MQRSNLNSTLMSFQQVSVVHFVETKPSSNLPTYACLAIYNTARRQWDQKNMMGIQTLHPPWRETPAAAWITSKKKELKETQDIHELRNVVVYIGCDWSLRSPCDFCGELLCRAVHVCPPWFARCGKFTQRTELERQNLLVHQSERCPLSRQSQTKQCHDTGDLFRINMQLSPAHAPPAAAHVIGRSSQM